MLHQESEPAPLKCKSDENISVSKSVGTENSENTDNNINTYITSESAYKPKYINNMKKQYRC